MQNKHARSWLSMLVIAAVSCSTPGSIVSRQHRSDEPAAPGCPEPKIAAESPTVDVGPPGVVHAPLFVGRFDTSDAAGPKAAWPGTRILARFDGTAVSVTLSEF